MMEEKTLQDALNIRFNSDAGDDITIRDYFRILLETLWGEGEGFSGKRPFGNSCWEYDLYRPLAINGFIQATVEDDEYCIGGYDVSFTREQQLEAEAYVFDLIEEVFKQNESNS